MIELKTERKEITITTVTKTKNISTIGYTIREAAELRGVHPKTVRRQIWRGEVFAELKGNLFIIPPLEMKKIKAKSGGRPRKLVH